MVLEIHPVRNLGADYRAWQLGALVLIVDPAARPRVDPDLAAAVLGLTPAESRLAVMVASGHSVRSIATLTGRTEGTVRWHLKQIFRKQRISRQSDLVRRVLSLDGFPGSER